MKRSWSLPDFSWNLVWQKGEKDREAGDHLSLCRQNRRVDQRLEGGEEPGEHMRPAPSPSGTSGTGI